MDIITDNLTLMFGNCLDRMREIPSGSVDMILTDPPYGTVKGIGGNSNIDHGMKGKTEWDNVLDTFEMMNESNRILRKNGKMILFAQQPFTTELINGAIPNLPFNYSMIWEKDHFANALTAKKAPLNYYEDVLVFSKNHDENNSHPLAEYLKIKQFEKSMFWNGSLAEHYVEKGFSKSIGNAKAVLKHFLNWEYVQFSTLTEEHYDRLNPLLGFDISHSEMKRIGDIFKMKTPSIFNLWEGKKYKSNILKYKKDYDGHHPTQKPIALLEDLIKTFSNEGDLIVDFTMGSGSTGVACVNTGRKFIGIELDPTYYGIACGRVLTTAP